MAAPTGLTLRQTLEGMTLNFDASAAGELEATLQFNVTGQEPGSYHLRIADGDCAFHLGAADDPSLTINTPSDVWLKISRGELDGQQALMSGQYQVKGNLSLLLRMNQLFRVARDTAGERPAYAASPDQRPAGPIALPGMTWMSIAYVPWTIHWVLYDIPGVSAWLSVGIPFLFALLTVGYRLAFNKPTRLEFGGLGFFALAGLLSLLGSPTFALWGSVISQIVMGALWLSSLVFSGMPLCGEYSKWGYTEKLWHTSLFLHPNVAISLVWGGQSLASSLLGGEAILAPNLVAVLTVARYALLVPAFIFTALYQKGAENRPIANVDRALAQMRAGAGVGLIVALGMILVICFAL